MPWVVRDVVDEINRAAGRRWPGLDRLLPPRAELPEELRAILEPDGRRARPNRRAKWNAEGLLTVA